MPSHKQQPPFSTYKFIDITNHVHLWITLICTSLSAVPLHSIISQGWLYVSDNRNKLTQHQKIFWNGIFKMILLEVWMRVEAS